MQDTKAQVAFEITLEGEAYGIVWAHTLHQAAQGAEDLWPLSVHAVTRAPQYDANRPWRAASMGYLAYDYTDD